MKKNVTLCLAIILCLIPISAAFAENQPVIKIVVLDSQTSKPVPYVNIAIDLGRYGQLGASSNGCNEKNWDRPHFGKYRADNGELAVQPFRFYSTGRDVVQEVCIKVWRDGCDAKIFNEVIKSHEPNSLVFFIDCMPRIKVN